jgi:hypothetical protein
MVQLAGLNGERSTDAAAAKKSAPNSQPTADPAWKAPVAKAPPGPKNPLVSATAKTDASGQPLPLDVQFNTGRVASPATMPARFLPVKQAPVQGPDGESPEDAKNGSDAAKDLLSKDNPRFYDHRLYQADPDFDPDLARAQAFAATLSNYGQKGDNANIAALINGLGPDEAARLLTRAGSLQGPQVNGSGTVYAQNQAGVAEVLAKALLAPGVELGNGTQQGTLAYSLLQQATSGSNALTIAGILNASGTGPDMVSLKQQFLDEVLVRGKALGKPSPDQAGYANAARTLINGDPVLLSRYPGGIGVQQIFGTDAGVPDVDRDFLNKIKQGIDLDLYGSAGTPGDDPVILSYKLESGSIQEYLAGKKTQNESPSELLANMMSVLGPQRTYAALAQMPPDQVRELQGALNELTKTGQFTADDAKSLALAQAKFGDRGSVESFIASLPAGPNGTAVKAGYAEGCISGAQQLTQVIASGKYSGQLLDGLTLALHGLGNGAAKVSSDLPAPVKIQLFSDLHTAATVFAKSGNGKEAAALNAYAAGVLDAGKPGDQAQMATALRAMGGVGAYGAIDPNSDLGKFLQSALRGQAEFGLRSPLVSPLSDIPDGLVTHLLNGLAASGDTKLSAGVLDMVMQWSIKNPGQAAALAAQDTPGGTGYRNALTNLLDKSFNQFVGLLPSDPDAALVRTMQPQTIASLQALSAIAMGPPYNSQITGNFAGIMGKHSIQFAAYAEGQVQSPELDSLLAGGGDLRHSSALIFGEVMKAFGAGFNQSAASLRAQAANPDLARFEKQTGDRVVTDWTRGAGTGLLLLSAWLPRTKQVPIGFGKAADAEKLVSIVGRGGLFLGSLGTALLDQAVLNDTKTEEEAIQAVSQGIQAADLTPAQAMEQIYKGWFFKISQIPGVDGQKITDGLMTGSSFGGAATIEPGVQAFYSGYNPIEYYHDATGDFPPIGR